jgi:hypothetical protein
MQRQPEAREKHNQSGELILRLLELEMLRVTNARWLFAG